MPKRKKGELPSGNVRRNVLVGYKYETGPDGKLVKKRIYKSVTASSTAEVNRMAAELKAGLRPIGKTEMKLGDAIDKYLKDNSGTLSPSSIKGYMSYHCNYDHLRDYKLGDLDNEFLQSWINTISYRVSPKTVKNTYDFIQRVLGVYEIHPRVNLPKRPKKDAVIPVDDNVVELIHAFINKGDKDMINAINLAAFATLRRSEISALKAEDVSGTVIHVRRAQVVGPNNKLIERDIVKTSKSNRYIEIPDFVVSRFPTEGYIVNLHPDVIESRYNRMRKKLGFDCLNFHSLRHYTVSIMHAIGVPDEYILNRGGWETDYVMKNVYRDVLPDWQKKFVAQTNDYFVDIATRMLHEKEKSP